MRAMSAGHAALAGRLAARRAASGVGIPAAGARADAAGPRLWPQPLPARRARARSRARSAAGPGPGRKPCAGAPRCGPPCRVPPLRPALPRTAPRWECAPPAWARRPALSGPAAPPCRSPAPRCSQRGRRAEAASLFRFQRAARARAAEPPARRTPPAQPPPPGRGPARVPTRPWRPAEADALLAQAERLLRERRGRPPRCALAVPAASQSPPAPRARRPSSSAVPASDSDASAGLRANAGAEAARRGGDAGLGPSRAGHGPGGRDAAAPGEPGTSSDARRRRASARPHGELHGARAERARTRSQGFASGESASDGASAVRRGDTLDYQLSEEEGTLGSDLGSERDPGGQRMPRELLATGRFLDTEDVLQLLETGLGPAPSMGEPTDGASDDEAESRVAVADAAPRAQAQAGAQGAGSAGPGASAGAQAPEEPAELSLGAWVCSGGQDTGIGSGDPGSRDRAGSSRGSAPASLDDDGMGPRGGRGAATPASTLSSAGSSDTETLGFATPGGATPGSFHSREASDDDEDDDAGGAEPAWQDADFGFDPNAKGKLPAGMTEAARRRSAELCAICMDAPLQVRACMSRFTWSCAPLVSGALKKCERALAFWRYHIKQCLICGQVHGIENKLAGLQCTRIGCSRTWEAEKVSRQFFCFQNKTTAEQGMCFRWRWAPAGTRSAERARTSCARAAWRRRCAPSAAATSPASRRAGLAGHRA